MNELPNDDDTLHPVPDEEMATLHGEMVPRVECFPVFLHPIDFLATIN